MFIVADLVSLTSYNWVTVGVVATSNRQESHGNPRLAFVADFHDIELFGR